MDKQKIIETSKIFIVDAKTGKELEIGRISYVLDDMTNAFTEATNECGRLTVALTAIVRLFKRPRRLKTGVIPKIQNRTKKKQR